MAMVIPHFFMEFSYATPQATQQTMLYMLYFITIRLNSIKSHEINIQHLSWFNISSPDVGAISNAKKHPPGAPAARAAECGSSPLESVRRRRHRRLGEG